MLALVTPVFGDHTLWPIVKEKAIEEGTGRACEFHRVERCLGLRAPFPGFARTAGEPCPSEPWKVCLGNGAPLSGWYDGIHRVVILPRKNNEALRHEFVHAIKHAALGDGDFEHTGHGWECE